MGEKEDNNLMKKLNLREGDTVITMNLREFIEYLLILKQKILTNPLAAYEFVEQMEIYVGLEMKNNG